MPILDFEASAAKGPAPKKPIKLLLGAGVLVGALALGSTFAASINLNGDGGGDVEFGQGVVAATACDPGITITPFSTFINATGGGEHRLSSIRLSGIDSSAGDCEGKTFRIRAYGDGPDPLDLFQWEERDYDAVTDTFGQWSTPVSYDFVDIKRTATDFLWTSGGTDNDDVINIVDQRNQADLEQTAFTLKLVSEVDVIRRTPLVSTDVLKKITVESRDTVDAAPASYAVGDEGPGGGIIFYVATTPFNCGPTFTLSCSYLEVAPDGWNGDTGDNIGFPWALPAFVEVDVPDITNVDRVYDSSGIGLGYKNSIAIGEQGNDEDVATILALAYVNTATDADDWYLPSVDELDILCRWNLGLNPLTIEDCQGGTPQSPTYGAQTSGLLENFYWSSSESSPNEVLVRAMRSGENGGFTSKSDDSRAVRPIRAF